MGQHYLMMPSRYVGNTMATFIMQALGCEVAALNTVQFSTLSLLTVSTRPYLLWLLFSFHVSFLFMQPSGERGVKLYLGNHTGYHLHKGTKASAQEIHDLYLGLKLNRLDDFDVLLSGYAPSAEAVQAIGSTARELRLSKSNNPGSFFWSGSIYPSNDNQSHASLSPPLFSHLSLDDQLTEDDPVLDPVMGDQGRLYVDPDVVPIYKNLLHNADLILPNQFEAE